MNIGLGYSGLALLVWNWWGWEDGCIYADGLHFPDDAWWGECGTSADWLNDGRRGIEEAAGGLLDDVLQDAERAAVCAGRICEARCGWVRDDQGRFSDGRGVQDPGLVPEAAR